MIIYSQTINTFRAKVRSLVREILQKEMQIKVRKNRFEWNGYLIPFNVVVFEHSSKLGYFDHHNYQIGLNRCLLTQAKTEVIKDIVRHELAHFFTYLQHGSETRAHGSEFHQICNSYGWNDSVSAATGNLDQLNAHPNLAHDKVISKVKKLLNLASSSNGHEAQLATVKANQLLLKYNLENINSDEEELVYAKKVLEAKRNCAKFQTIYEILKTFMVSPVFNYGKGVVYLEVIGDYVNVELADYVANFLNNELEKMWKEASKDNAQLKGITAKNSFMKGVARGYLDKIRDAQKSTSGKDLILLSQALEKKLKLVYTRLSGTASRSSKQCRVSEGLGNAAGKSLSIRPGLKKGGVIQRLLGY